MYAANVAVGLARRLDDRLTLIGVRDDAALLDRVGTANKLPFVGSNYHVWLQRHAGGQARRARANFCHYTNAAAPLLSRVPYVVTVHDLSLLRMPRTHPFARRLTVPVMLAALARAQAIVVPSEFTRRELARLRVSPRRVTVIAHAPTPRAASFDRPAAESLIGSLGLLPHQYVLAVGTLEPRKNLVRLVAAFERLAGAWPDLKLVLVGAPGWQYQPILERIDSSPHRDRVIVSGYQGEADLDALIGLCGVSAYVSVYEGFGMPVLDAMARGAAVVASDSTAVPEAAGGAALLVDPLDVGAIARGLDEGMRQRASLAAAGLARAGSRSWQDVADEHVDVYRWVAQGR